MSTYYVKVTEVNSCIVCIENAPNKKAAEELAQSMYSDTYKVELDTDDWESTEIKAVSPMVVEANGYSLDDPTSFKGVFDYNEESMSKVGLNLVTYEEDVDD